MANVENCLLILGLGDYSPKPGFVDMSVIGTSDEDPSVKTMIDAAIKSKQVEWTEKKDDPKKGYQYRNYIENIPNFRNWLSTVDQRRTQYAEAKAYVDRVLRKRLGIPQKKGYMLDIELDSIAKGEELPVSVVRKYVIVEVRAQQAKGQALKKPASADKYKTIDAPCTTLSGSEFRTVSFENGSIKKIIPSECAIYEDTTFITSSSSKSSPAASKNTNVYFTILVVKIPFLLNPISQRIGRLAPTIEPALKLVIVCGMREGATSFPPFVSGYM